MKDNRNQRDRSQWTPTQVAIDWVESCLVNDEASTDEELKNYFIESGLTQKTADAILAQRNAALLDGLGFELNIANLDFTNSKNGIKGGGK